MLCVRFASWEAALAVRAWAGLRKGETAALCGVVEKQRVRLRALIARVRDWSIMKAGVHAGDEIQSSDTQKEKARRARE